jgi:hypothetical protein
MMGLEGWSGAILPAPLPLIGGTIGGPSELTPPVVPVRTFFCRSRTGDLLAGKLSCVLRRGSGSRRNRGAVLAPAELAPIAPGPVQNPRPGAWRPRRWLEVFRAAEPPARATFSHDHFPLGRARIGHPTGMVGLAGMVALQGQANMRADRPGMNETLRLVDRRPIGQRNDRADPWSAVISRRHTESPRTVSSSILCRTASCWRITRQTLRRGSVIAASPGKPTTNSRTRASYRKPLTAPTFKPKLRNVPRKSDSTSSSCAEAACGWSAARAAPGTRRFATRVSHLGRRRQRCLQRRDRA